MRICVVTVATFVRRCYFESAHVNIRIVRRATHEDSSFRPAADSLGILTFFSYTDAELAQSQVLSIDTWLVEAASSYSFRRRQARKEQRQKTRRKMLELVYGKRQRHQHIFGLTARPLVTPSW